MVAAGRNGVTSSPDVLVVGAGPTGLALALQAHDHGARVRVVERRKEPFRPSRAMVMHPRTLEVLRPFGIVDALLERADTAPTARLHVGSRVVEVGLADVALADTAFPHLSLLRQMDVEAILAEALAERGVPVERGTELVDIRADRAVLWSAEHVEEAACMWVAACDGAASTVRRLVGVGWRGATYRNEVVLADVELDGDLARAAQAAVGRHGLLFAFPAGERATWRVLATRPANGSAPPGMDGPPVDQAELQRLVTDAGLDVRVTRIAWSTAVGLQHRLADRYRVGRFFLAGDAAHTHSPAAAQGMNTGIQDAANLGWKLALVAGSACADTLLDSYEAERRPVDRHVLALTHHAFWAEASTDPVASFLRGTLAPLLAPAVPCVLGRRWLVAAGVRLLGQLDTRYPRSPLSREGTVPRSGRPRPGDRLPDAVVTSGGRRVRLHELLARPGVHLLLQRDAHAPARLGPAVHVHRIESDAGRGVLAIRPDGYVGFRGGAVDDPELASWLALVGARPE